MSTAVRFWRPSSLVLVAAAALGCHPYVTVPAPFGGVAIDSIPIATIRTYAATLRFDTVPGAADAQRLSILKIVGPDTFKVNGPFARIAPESGAYGLNSATLAQGRIIARIWSEAPYPKAGLHRGVNWWWVDQRGGTWRSMIISDSAGTRTPRPLFIHHHEGAHQWRQAIARFVWLDNDEQLWGTCGWSDCCATTQELQ